MIEGIQWYQARAGEAGCYYDSLCFLAEMDRMKHGNMERIDPIAWMSIHVASKAIDPTTFFVLKADRVFSDLTGRMFKVLYASDGLRSDGTPYDLTSAYQIQDGEYEILRFEKPDGSGHFVVGKGGVYKGIESIAFDPYKNPLTGVMSETVRIGKLISRRILREIK